MNRIENLVDFWHDTGLLYCGVLILLSFNNIKSLESCRKAKQYWEQLDRDFPTSKLKDNDSLKSVIDAVGAFLDDNISVYEQNK